MLTKSTRLIDALRHERSTAHFRQSTESSTPNIDQLRPRSMPRSDEQVFLINGTCQVIQPTDTCAPEPFFVLLNRRLLPVDQTLQKSWAQAVSMTGVTQGLQLAVIARNGTQKRRALIRWVRTDELLVSVEPLSLLTDETLQVFAGAIGLSPVESKVLALMALDLSPKRIAARRCTAVSTVRSQIKQVLKKSGEPNIRSLIATMGRLARAEAIARMA